MSRFTEYTVRAGLRASWRRAASPTTTPAGVKATIEGSRTRPSASGMTRGMPRSTQATRLLVVPRSMPTMRGMRRQLLSEGIGEVLDDGPEIRPRGQALLEPPEQGGAVAAGVDGRVPVAPPRDDRRLLARATVDQPLPLLGEPGPRGRREAVGLGLL